MEQRSVALHLPVAASSLLTAAHHTPSITPAAYHTPNASPYATAGSKNGFNVRRFNFPSPSHQERQSNKRGRSSSLSPPSSVVPTQAALTTTPAPPSFNRFKPPPKEQSRHSVQDLVQQYPGVQANSLNHPVNQN